MSAQLPKGYEMYSLPTMGADQNNIYQMLKGQFQQGSPGVYNNLFKMAQGDSDMFSQMEAPAIRQFQQQIAPQIAQRYAGSGIGASSGMQNSLAGAGANLAESLQGKRMDLMQRSMQDVLGLGDKLLGMPTAEFGKVKKDQGPDIMSLLKEGAGPLGDILLQLFGKKKGDTSEGLDWGSVASSAAKFLPLLAL